VAILVFFGVYMCGYYAMLDPLQTDYGSHVSDGLLPAYRVNGAIIKALFWPANQIDRHVIRPKRWEWDDWG
jgi:hypothetical protein